MNFRIVDDLGAAAPRWTYGLPSLRTTIPDGEYNVCAGYKETHSGFFELKNKVKVVNGYFDPKSVEDAMDELVKLWNRDFLFLEGFRHMGKDYLQMETGT